VGQIRSDGYKSFDHNASTAQNAAGRALGRGANKHMLDKSSSKELIAGIHKEKEKLIHGKAVLKHLDGKKALGEKGVMQKLLHGAGEYAGLYIGDKLGGPIGAVLGDMVGKNFIKTIDKRYGKNVFDKPAVRKALGMLKEKDPKIYDKIEKKLNQYGTQAEKNKWNMPGESDISKKSHDSRMNKKRGDMAEKKKGIMEGTKVASPYEPYKEQGIINFGKKTTPKNKQSVKGMRTIR
jgi:hypothetical protein